MRVPAYAPSAIAEHAVALMLTLNRHVHKAYNRVREGSCYPDRRSFPCIARSTKDPTPHQQTGARLDEGRFDADQYGPAAPSSIPLPSSTA